MIQHLFSFEDLFTSMPLLNVQRGFLVKYSFSFVHFLAQLNYFVVSYIP
jgi:hypothetical protein